MIIPFIFFWGSLLMLFYIYFGYPIVLCLLSILVGEKKVIKAPYQPHVTILIAAYNEEKVIEATIRNKLALNYPPEKLEIVIISDSSDDGTDKAVDALISERKKRASDGKKSSIPTIKLMRQEPRAGKTSALNMAVPHAIGEIIVFSDANSMYDNDTLSFLMQNFVDPDVGYVTGKMIYTNPQGSLIGDGCTTYMKYENVLRGLETKIGSIVGVDGGIDAVRKSLYKPMNPDQLPDFVLPLSVVDQGYRVVYEPFAILKETVLSSYEDEYKMRVRVSLRALWALYDMRHLLYNLNNSFFAWELISHKILRYLAFFFLATLLVSNAIIFENGIFYSLFLFLQVSCYSMAMVSLFLEKLGHHSKLLYLPYYFTLINLASIVAFFKFLQGKKMTTWVPRKA